MGTKLGSPPNIKKAMREIDWFRYKVDAVQIEKKKEEVPLICYWEIMYQYLNPEVSLAYPQHVFPKDKVAGRTYFGTKSLCQRACDALNGKIKGKTTIVVSRLCLL